eukprot:415211-Rhodomonas_salina.3
MVRLWNYNKSRIHAARGLPPPCYLPTPMPHYGPTPMPRLSAYAYAAASFLRRCRAMSLCNYR